MPKPYPFVVVCDRSGVVLYCVRKEYARVESVQKRIVEAGQVARRDAADAR